VNVVVDDALDPAVLTVTTPPATRGRPVTTTIRATGAGGSPSGEVTLTRGGVALGTASLGPTGTATVTWTPSSAGAATLIASYTGDSRFASATSAPTTVPVARSASVLSFRGKVKAGRKGKVTVTVGTVAGVAPTGTVTLRLGTRSFTARLVGGAARVKIGKVPDKKRLKVTAAYSGDAQYAGGTARHTFRVTSRLI
jgi:hypothetical protein